MRCQSCGAENPPHAMFCLSCGARLVQPTNEPPRQAVPARQYLATQTQATISKMLDSPGMVVLAIGLLLLLIMVIALAVGAWVAAIGVFLISMIFIGVGLTLRGHEASIAAAHARYAPQVIRNTELKEREIIKVKCRHCGALNPDGARNCGSCGAPL